MIPADATANVKQETKEQVASCILKTWNTL